MNLRVILDGARTGEANMAADAALAGALMRGEIPPTLRLYGWAPPALSIGYHQDEGDLDAEKLRSAGIGLVRRPTGGRAILHWHELTYAVALPLSAGSPRELYMTVHEALLGGIRSMGIDAVLGEADGDLRGFRSSTAGIACFSTAAGSEIRAGGRKLAGSAQRKVGSVILQHGSFLLGPQHRRIAEFIRAGSGADPLPEYASKTTEAETILGRPVPFGEAARAVAAAFAERFSTPGFPAVTAAVDRA